LYSRKEKREYKEKDTIEKKKINPNIDMRLYPLLRNYPPKLMGFQVLVHWAAGSRLLIERRARTQITKYLAPAWARKEKYGPVQERARTQERRVLKIDYDAESKRGQVCRKQKGKGS
jgi:hypothetical protein